MSNWLAAVDCLRNAAPYFEEQVYLYHGVLIYSPIQSTQLEELSVSAFLESGASVSWNPSSHSTGADIMVNENDQDFLFQMKAGKFNKNHLKISGGRTTSCETLEEKISYLAEHILSWDCIAFLERTEMGKIPSRYYLYAINPACLNPHLFHWEPTFSKKEGKLSGYAAKNDNGIIVKITQNLSGQLWVDVPRNLVNSDDVILIEEIKVI